MNGVGFYDLNIFSAFVLFIFLVPLSFSFCVYFSPLALTTRLSFFYLQSTIEPAFVVHIENGLALLSRNTLSD